MLIRNKNSSDVTVPVQHDLGRFARGITTLANTQAIVFVMSRGAGPMIAKTHQIFGRCQCSIAARGAVDNLPGKLSTQSIDI